MKEGTRKAMKAESLKIEVVEEKKRQSTQARRQKTCFMAPVAFTMRTWMGREFPITNEGLLNILKVAKRSGPEPRSTSRRKEYKSRISNATSCKIFGIESIHIRNDPASAKIQKKSRRVYQGK
jgi:hypothetical protein